MIYCILILNVTLKYSTQTHNITLCTPFHECKIFFYTIIQHQVVELEKFC